MTTKQSSIVKMHPAFTKTNAFFVRLYLASGETASLFQSDLKMLGYAGYSEELYRIELLGQAIRFSRTPIPVNIRKDGEYWKITSIQPRTNERPDQPLAALFGILTPPTQSDSPVTNGEEDTTE